jgi:hypothetical protein
MSTYWIPFTPRRNARHKTQKHETSIKTPLLGAPDDNGLGSFSIFVFLKTKVRPFTWDCICAVADADTTTAATILKGNSYKYQKLP